MRAPFPGGTYGAAVPFANNKTRAPLVLFVLPLYFLLAVGVAAVLLLPPVRARAGAWISAFWRGIGQRAASAGDVTVQAFGTTSGMARGGISSALRFIVSNRLIIIAMVVAISLPSVIVLSMGSTKSFQFDDSLQIADSQVQALLLGERLVPPPPLPPEVFVTREVEQIRPSISSASRDWNLLDVDFRQRLLLTYKIMREQHGYEVVLIEGYRSPERQARLAGQGTHVTNAGAYQSYHQYGMAADSAFFRDGKIVISEKDPWAMRGYQLYGEVAESVGLTWGGRWKMMDFGHVELRRRGVLGTTPPGVAQ